jgi:hypothetical protein
MMCHLERPWRFALRGGVATTLALAFFTLSVLGSPVGAQPGKDKDEPPKGKEAPKLGVTINDPKALQGYTLLSPLLTKKTYLIDMTGKVVREWDCKCTPATCAYLLDNGNLLRPGNLGGEEKSFGGGPGAGGRVQEYTWDGELVWDYRLFNDKQLPHHDITRMPNGNILMIVWDKKSSKDTIAAGRRAEAVGSHFLPDSILEVKKTGKTTGQIVWEWYLWDHLIQDHDKDKANFGDVAAHPELVDINFGQDIVGAVAAKKDGLDKLKGIGYGAFMGKGPTADWTHCNSVAYNADLDQIVISVHSFSELWVIDHSTTTLEAASHKGGKSGKGGDLLYRWGNPRAYRAGTAKDQRFFAQHNAHWIPKGLPGEGHIMVFNNGGRRPDGSYSSIDEIVPPVDSQGHYAHKPGTAYGPDKAVWTYTAEKKSDFFSHFISGAQRLANGNTLICSGANGIVFEVTPKNEVVWKFLNPSKSGPGGGPGPVGFPPKGGFGPPVPGQILPSFIQDSLKLTEEQKKNLGEFQKEVSGKLDKILTEDQTKQFKDFKPGFGGGGFGALPQPGQLMSPFLQTRLKLSDEQKKQTDGLQKEVDAKLDKLLAEDQKKQLKELRSAGAFRPPGGGFGGPTGSSLFRAYRFAPNHPALAGRELTPGKTIDELQAKETKGK